MVKSKQCTSNPTLYRREAPAEPTEGDSCCIKQYRVALRYDNNGERKKSDPGWSKGPMDYAPFSVEKVRDQNQRPRNAISIIDRRVSGSGET